MVPSVPSSPHPALVASEHLIPALKSFLPTLQSHIHKHGITAAAFRLYYARADPLHTAIWLCTSFSGFVWITEQITGNASQVDRLWTFLPVIYTIHFTFHKYIASILVSPGLKGFFSTAPGKGSLDNIEARLLLIFGLQVLWSARLTFHAIRRGFFKKGEEDYRWPVLRKILPKPLWLPFSLFFIAIAQNILLAMTALPQYMILTSTWHTLRKASHPPSQLTVWDWALAAATIVNLTLEMVSDQQQWVFQNYKRGLDSRGKPLPAAKTKTIKSEPDVKRGFATRGLFAYSRHPNFFFEQVNWWLWFGYVLVTFAPANGPIPWSALFLNYAILSPVFMNFLFLASTAFTEWITAGKYPAYNAYRKRVGMFTPTDTLVRSLYYRFIASEESRRAVEEEVWGDPSSGKTK